MQRGTGDGRDDASEGEYAEILPCAKQIRGFLNYSHDSYIAALHKRCVQAAGQTKTLHLQ
jgi:hypothetical protein